MTSELTDPPKDWVSLGNIINEWLVSLLMGEDWVSVCDGVKMNNREYETSGLLETWTNFRDREK